MLAMIRDVGVEYWDGYELKTCKRIEHNVDTGIGIYLKHEPLSEAGI